MDAAVALREFLSIGTVSVYSFLAIASWWKRHRCERQAYYSTGAHAAMSRQPARRDMTGHGERV
jgi:hypothetical protein